MDCICWQPVLKSDRAADATVAIVESFDKVQTSETESSLEINVLIGKIKHTVKRVRKENPDKK